MGYFTVKNVTNFILGSLALAAALAGFFYFAKQDWVKKARVEMACAKVKFAAFHKSRKEGWKKCNEETKAEIKAAKAKIAEEQAKKA